jgi:hypothetical protein
MKFILTLSILFLSLLGFAQDGVVKSVVLDSIMVSAVKGGFSVEEFVHYVKTDTSFYQGFKNLRYYSHDYKSNLAIFDKKDTIGFLYREGSYNNINNRLHVRIDSSYDNGKVYNRRGEYRSYTPEFFDHIFFPKDTLKVSKLASSEQDSYEQGDKNSRNEQDAKVILFNPGSIEVEREGSKKEKLAVFDESMQKYYDYLITKTTYKDSIDCYVFTCRMKTDLSEKDQDEVLIKELVSYFDKKTFNVVYRKYSMSYEYWLIDLDVAVEVEMGYVQDQIVPKYISYKGFWDVPFNKPEIADFQLWNSNFIVRD